MTIKSWREEFIPTPADEVSDVDIATGEIDDGDDCEACGRDEWSCVCKKGGE